MNLSSIFGNGLKLIKSHSPEILTALGVSGLITTSYLASKASFKAAEVIDHEQYILDLEDKSHPLDNKEKAKLVWKLYIPTVISGTVTIGCIVMASKSHSRRTTAAVTAYSLTEKAFSEYKEKVVEHIGKGKEQKVRDEIAQDKVTRAFESCSNEVFIFEDGEVLCCELATGRFFKSEMELLRRAENEINAKVVNLLYVTLDDFYDLVGLNHTSMSDKHGWDSAKLMKLEFTTTLSPNNKPCLAFDYNYTKPI